LLRKVLLAVAVLNVLDFLTTKLCIALGMGYEANPVAGALMEVELFDLVKLTPTLLALLSIHRVDVLSEGVARKLTWVTTLAVAVLLVATVNNVVLLVRSIRPFL